MSGFTESRMRRRQFLLRTCGIAAGASLGDRSSGKLQPVEAAARSYDFQAEIRKYRKVDAHNHLLSAPPRAVIEAADRLGIERLAISIPKGDQPSEFRESNDRVLKAMTDFPGRFLGQCFVNPVYPREAMQEMLRCIDRGMVGLGELYTQVKINDPVCYPLIEKCIALRIPVLVHARGDLGLLRKNHRREAPPATSTPDDLADIGRRYPEAIVIHAHIGGGGDWEYMCKRLRDVPSIRVDTSGSVTDEGMIEFAVRHLGASRVLFAADENFESGVGKILAADLTEEQRRMIFWDNFDTILKQREKSAD